MKKKLLPVVLAVVLLFGMLLATSCSFVEDALEIVKDKINGSEGNTENNSDNDGQEDAEKYTVTFVDWDGTTLKTQEVEAGKAATAPADPAREGYTFTGWDKSFDKIAANTTVTAMYEAVAVEAIVVDSVEVGAGETVMVNVKIQNNPGVAGAVLKISYDSKLTLTSAVSGEAFSALQFTQPGRFVSPCNFSWDSESGMATEDGTILTLQFTVSATAAAGEKLNVSCSYRTGDIYDENLNDVTLDIINGEITIK